MTPRFERLGSQSDRNVHNNVRLVSQGWLIYYVTMLTPAALFQHVMEGHPSLIPIILSPKW
jgi:hypothetical protein